MKKHISGEEKTVILNQIEQRARSEHSEFGSRGQNVLHVLQKELDLPGDQIAVKAAGFMGGGTASMCNMCGALVGGIMAIGLACGREDLKDSVYPEAKDIDEATGLPKTQMIIRRFYQRFIQEFGSWICRDLQIRMLGRSYDLGIPAEKKKFDEAGGKKLCAELVGKAARLATETILPRR